VVKRRSFYRPAQPAVVDTVSTAIKRAQALSPEHVLMQRAITETALDNLRQGHDCAAAWRSLVDAANMSTTLAGMGLGGGAEAQRVVRDAIAALAAVQQRQAAGGSWTLYATELDALHWLLRLHNTAQLPACSYGEFHRAMHVTNERVKQARAGNAAPGTTVVVGDLAGQPLGA
jgi:hypothetical protein